MTSYVELGSTVFRGNLDAATGDVEFKLTADAIDVADTIHFQGGAVTYAQYVTFSGPAGLGVVFLDYTFNVPEDAVIEFMIYGFVMEYFKIDNVDQVRFGYYGNDPVFPVRFRVELTAGSHNLKLIGGSTTEPTTSGYALIKFIRSTGS